MKTAFAALFLLMFLSVLIAFSVGFNPEALSQTQDTYGVEVAFPQLTFSQPVGIYHAGDRTGRLFVVEQRGSIQVFENSPSSTSKVFLDITDRVLFGGEQGLLGLAFHPSYQTNGYFYVDYVANNPLRTVIARYSLMADDFNQANKSSELVLLEVAQPFSSHKGGQLAFGPDGYLYIALGDGGSGGDPFGNAQNRSSPLGKILRIDVDSDSGGRNYGIPTDNPFASNTVGYMEEIYAYGLRNPWKFSFDTVTLQLWAADVGQSQREEIDIIEKGKNYGWNIMEGTLTYTAGNQTGLELPIWEYDRDEGIAVIGGFVYRGSELTGLIGSYVYRDYGLGKIWGLSYNGPGTATNRLINDTNLVISSFGVDQQNELYMCAFDGKIYKLAGPDSVPPTIGTPSHIPQNPLPNQEVTISVNVTDRSGIQNITLSYRKGATWVNVSMTPVAGNTFTASLPALPNQTFVEYRIIANDNMGNMAINDNQGFLYSYSVIPEYPEPLALSLLLGATLLTSITLTKRKLNSSPHDSSS